MDLFTGRSALRILAGYEQEFPKRKIERHQAVLEIQTPCPVGVTNSDCLSPGRTRPMDYFAGGPTANRFVSEYGANCLPGRPPAINQNRRTRDQRCRGRGQK